ncbi:phosphoethanolamine--lipid A transferase [Acinetobacter venetianus]|uniref:phosphoethanolamine transferase n=1 Tax=Acinetobacter venetianus TaxID=52133 RepID=UPI0017867107|nr:phosphoethanolamine--lipid A transferase [Acinetobacter venetianus]MCR4531503.1 phosphoethanolamine--lipid A transferase [Acinetobacter venetianus]MDA0697434.1 phosphoethanolamine--lipid A transferase [Pseudomonadota bacterium]MDA1254311.1 phosphoethanolamine--lipid A transferase [Pseudomonadota bacterium]QNH51904.1 phosphoethanolamine--lipid A transferase [Acinetobacter venetianus]
MLLQKLKIRPISLLTFNLLLAIWLGVFLNIAFYEKLQSLTPYTGIKAGLFVTASVLVVVALYNFIFQLFNWKWTAKPIAIALVFIGGFASYAVSTLGVLITSDQVQNLMQTDMAEARDTWSWHLVVWTLGMTVLPIIAILMVKLKSEPIVGQLLKKVIASVVSLAMVGGLLFVFYVDFAAIFRENRDLKGMISPQNMIASFASYYKKKAPKENLPLVTYGEDATMQKTDASKLPKLMVLVVGETARAENFSLNGYSKNTNPKLSKQDIINFSQVSSCGTATAVSVPCMFSGMPREDYDESLANHREGLLDIAKRAGYQVTWIDNNSGCKGTCDRVEEFKIPEPIQKKWCKDEECFDDILIDSLKAYLATIPKDDTRPHLVVLHQMGSHGPAYYKRVPPQYKVFKPTCDTNAIQGCSRDELLNSYDNTLLYTDYVLDSLIETLKTATQYETGLWYLSDHGESTGESGMYLHGAPYAIAPSQQTHVPMLMWFSDTWKQQAQKQMSCLSQQRQKELSQDNLFPTMLSLLDVKTKVIDPKNDMLATCSNP